MWLTSSSYLPCFALLITTELLLGWGDAWNSEELSSSTYLSSRIGRNSKVRCPENWMNYKGSCYGLFTKPKTWKEAELRCRHYGPRSNLASILDEEEMEAIANFITPQIHEPVWIGLFDHNMENNKKEQGRDWWWMDAYKVTYLPWAEGEPDNKDTLEGCVELVPSKGFMKWNDRGCGWELPFLCKYELKYQ